jgi:hypothetical protein
MIGAQPSAWFRGRDWISSKSAGWLVIEGRGLKKKIRLPPFIVDMMIRLNKHQKIKRHFCFD